MRGTTGSGTRLWAAGTAVAAVLGVPALGGCGEGPATAARQDATPRAPQTREVAVRDAVAVHADQDGAWVLDYAGALTRVEADGTARDAQPITGDRLARDLDVFADDGRTVWVSEEGVGVHRVDRATGRRRGKPIEVGRQPAALELADGALFVGDAFDGTVRRVDPVARRITRRAPVGESIRSLAIADGALWAVDEGGDAVHRLEVDTLQPAGEPIEAEGTRPFHVSAAAGVVWVSDDDGVTAYEPQTGRRIGRYAPGVGSRPFVHGDDQEAWVVGATTGKAHRLDPRTARPSKPEVAVYGGSLSVARDAVWVVGDASVTRISR